MPRHKISPFIDRKQPRFCECGQHAWTRISGGYVTMVSVEDADLLRQRAWSSENNRKKKTIYVRSNSNKLHRIIMGDPNGMIVDHENGNGLDNQRRNLRICTVQQNAQNAPRHKDGSSRFKGVCWDEKRGKWVVQVCLDYKRKTLGSFDCEIEAAKIYDAFAIDNFGEFARLNFPT